jgi:hypothetical protein
MTLFEIMSSLDVNEDIHLARILILLRQFNAKNQSVDGMTKLAKLDFLLRYPVYLERAIKSKGRTGKDVDVKDFERISVESKMVRYKYGPWDFRYRRFLNILIAQGLVVYAMDGKTTRIALTDKGDKLAQDLISNVYFADIAKRATLLFNNFNYSGTYLKDFVYKTFPEIVSLNLRTEIE